MAVINAILSAVLVTAGSYGTICFYDKKHPLGVGKKGNFIFSRFIVGLMCLTFFATGIIGFKKGAMWGVFTTFLYDILIWGMSVLAVTDYKQCRIPNRFLTALLIIWATSAGTLILFRTEAGVALLVRSLAGGIVGGLIFLLCYFLSKKQLGAGDVKMVFVMGLYLTGERIIGVIFYGALLCCLYSGVQLFRKKIGIKDGVALAPFLYLGVLISLYIL